MTEKLNKNIILLVGPVSGPALAEVLDTWRKENTDYRIYNLISKKLSAKYIQTYSDKFDEIITCTFSKPDSIKKSILPFESEILAATCRSEAKMWYFEQTIPHIPYLRTPTAKSLNWSVNKISMRRRFETYDKTITPRFEVLNDYTKKTIQEIEKNVGYPCVVKPSGLAQSLLVTICYHRDELEATLKKVFKKVSILNRIYKEGQDKNAPTVLVEEYMEGDLYSFDGVVSSRGKIQLYPPVYVKTGDKIGFDDFFGYMQMTPTKLKPNTIEAAEHVARQSVRALGIRSSAVHVELLRTEDGWKVVEVGPRVGGFRHDLYKLSFGIDCTWNDIAIRIPEKITVNKKVKGHSALLKIYAKKEGTIKSIKGLKKVEALESMHKIIQAKAKGDKANFARNGGKAVFKFVVFNEDRSKLLADIRRIEKELVIEV